VETVWRYLTGAGLLCLLALPAQAQTVEVPAEVKAEPGMIVVPAQTAGKEVRWYAPDPGLQVIPSSLLKDSKTAVCIALKPGRYRLVAYTALADVPSEPAVCVVVVGNAPGPVPPPPDPDDSVAKDPLYQKLLPVYAADVTPGKADKAKQLAAVYRNAGAVTLNDPSITTLGRFYEVVSVASKQLVPPPALDAVRNAVAADHKAVLGERYDAPLDANAKAKVAAQFARVAAILERLAS
jgi:hypothetical protein